MIGDIADILDPRDLAAVAWCNFDHEWYALAYPDVLNEVDEPSFETLRDHYISTGRPRGFAPNMYFDEMWYQRRYRDVAEEIASGQIGSGYEHYCAIGYLSKSPHWLFDDDVYAAASPDLTEDALVVAECFNRYDHYLKVGAREMREAHLLFDPRMYRRAVRHDGGDLARLDALGPFQHFLIEAWEQRRDAATTIYFDAGWYLRRYEMARAALDGGAVCCALHHYLAAAGERGLAERAGRDPCPEFSEEFYLDRYPDVAAAVRDGVFQSGYEHFLKSGVFDLRLPCADIDLRAYLNDNAAARDDLAQGRCSNAFAHLLQAAAAPAAREPEPQAMAGMEAARTPLLGEGQVDFFGHHGAAHGWFFCGWLAPEHPSLTDDTSDAKVTFRGIAYFELGQIEGRLAVSSYFRPDLGGNGNGIGIIAYLEGSAHALGQLVSLNIYATGSQAGDAAWTVYPSEGAPLLRDGALVAPLRPILGQLTANTAKAVLVGLAMRHGYTGVNTLTDLRDRVLLELDEVIFCPPHGLLLVGWMLAHPGVVTALRVHSGANHHLLPPDHLATIERPDVLESVGAKFGFQNLRNGFIAYVPDGYLPGETAYIAVETHTGEVAYRGISEPRLRGMDAMRFVLDRVDARHDELVRISNAILGPALASLNHARLADSKGHEVITFGAPDPAPELSVIVPLYGRLDFMEYQFAFAARPEGQPYAHSAPASAGIAHEFIYVLDDPRLQRQAEQLAASIYARFSIPFRLVVLRHNLGFAPANNVALSLARGRYVGFVNSDVFAGSSDWMARLVARLEADATLGAVGPMLLFEDGSIQHIGMVFEPVPAFGNWMFPMHEQKGWRPPHLPSDDPATGLRHAAAITGACIVLSRALAVELGGFDEDYIIGDFEDADLCMKIAERGLSCAVDLTVRMYHLERQSQAAPDQRWRMNLTLHNAWVHDTRWGARLRLASPPTIATAEPSASIAKPEPAPAPVPEPPGTKRQTRAKRDAIPLKATRPGATKSSAKPLV